jgi:endonuclease YncB( thermonuclease family)
MRCFLAALLAALAIASSAHAHPGGLDKEGCHRDKAARQKHCHPERLRAKRLATCNLGHAPKTGEEGVFFGPLVRVLDGDTFDAKVQGVVMDFRLAEIDAPESTQPYGSKSRDELARLVKGKQLVIVPTDTDRYGRTVAFLWTDGVCINAELVRRGAAYFYDEYASDDFLYQIEKEARAAQRGVWALPPKDRIPPQIWRKERR